MTGILEQLNATMLTLNTTMEKLLAEAPAPSLPESKTRAKPEMVEAVAPKRTRAKKGQTAPEVTLEAVESALKKHAGELGRDETIALLAEFNAKKMSELKPAQFAKIVEQADAEVAAALTAGSAEEEEEEEDDLF